MKVKPPTHIFPLVLAIAALGAAVYLGAAQITTGSTGYPLDDAWIHQVFARNLAAHGQLSVNPGEPAAASTSPAWTGLLAAGYLAGVPHFLWTALLGVVLLALLGWETHLLSRALFPCQPAGHRRPSVTNEDRPATDESPGNGTHLAAGLLVVADWRMVWAGLSGMETVLFVLVSMGLLREYSDHGLGRPLRAGAMAGLLGLTRPEGVLLAGLLGLWHLWERRRPGVQQVLAFGLGCAALLAPLALINISMTGRPLPSTFYAKNASYGLGSDPLGMARYLAEAAQALAAGPTLLLMLGIVAGLWLSARGRGTAAARGTAARSGDGAEARPRDRASAAAGSASGSRRLVPAVWALLLLLAYMAWLPAVYHHGRYLLPLLPVITIYGLVYGARFLRGLPFPLLRRAAPVFLAVLAVIAWSRGAQVYAGNTAWINQQQVAAALWLRENTPPGTVIGTHDIGALAYFSERRLVDIAGLATRELTDSPRDIDRVLEVLDESGVSFLALFPDWYPPLYERMRAEGRLEVVYEGPPDTPPGWSGMPFQVARFRPIS